MTLLTIEQLLDQLQRRGLFLNNLFQLSHGPDTGLWQANVGDKQKFWGFALAEGPAEAIAQALAKAQDPEALTFPAKPQGNNWSRAKGAPVAPAAAAVDMEDLGL